MGDSALAMALAMLSAVVVALHSGTHLRSLMVAFAGAQTLPLAFRRQRPLWVLAVVVVDSSAAALIGGTMIVPPGLLVALYTVGAHCNRRDAVRAGVAAVVVLAWPVLHESNGQILLAVLKLGSLAAGWVFGAYFRELRALVVSNRREQQLRIARALAEEQARVGRELHDIIAHALSVVIVQAAAAGDVFDTSPEQAREALASIEAAGRSALAELRRVVDAVRADASEHDQRTPQPGLSQLDDLIGRVRATGLAVMLRTEGAGGDVPPGINLSAYRIIQEALTNTIKHAQATAAEVTVQYRLKELILDICDNGQGAGSGSGLGRGIIGMRERAAINGGTLITGPRPGGGFQVHARFPLPPVGSGG